MIHCIISYVSKGQLSINYEKTTSDVPRYFAYSQIYGKPLIHAKRKYKCKCYVYVYMCKVVQMNVYRLAQISLHIKVPIALLHLLRELSLYISGMMLFR